MGLGRDERTDANMLILMLHEESFSLKSCTSNHEIVTGYILNELSPGVSLEGMMLNLKLQYFGHFV